ncbi:MAG: uracil-DNA glycosylase [Bacteriovoracaceae bacterium]|nr:uracil-DNA glycosylase [Bacteroidota bacterium]
MSESEIEAVLIQARRFLQQQQAMYGNTLYSERVAINTSSVDSTGKIEESMAVKKKTVPATALQPIRIEEQPADQKEKWHAAADLAAMNKQICNCMKCGLGKTRTKFVFGVGNTNADLLVIGEAPGADEDKQGEPFVGRAGQLLNKILEAVQFTREEVYIANILKCRPPENRRPNPGEVEQCEPYLWKQIELIRPKFILCLGLTAAQTLLKTDESLTSLRASVHNYHNVPTYVTYHPAALLRNPNWKRPTWEDVQKLRKAYDESISNV